MDERHIRHTHQQHDHTALCGAELGPPEKASCWTFLGLNHVYNHYKFNAGYIQ